MALHRLGGAVTGKVAALACCVGMAIGALTGCAGQSTKAVREPQTVVVATETAPSPIAAHAPAFVLHGTEERYNRIGRVQALGSGRDTTVGIDPDEPVVYADTRPFETERGTYTNLVYRVHFSDLPFSLIPFHLGAGKHVGVLVVLTMDTHQQVLLVTLAQTCGCYAVTIPTRSLPVDRYPDDWPAGPLRVYGERLPALLPSIGRDERLHVVIRGEVHRVMDLQVGLKSAATAEQVHPAALLPLAALKQLPLTDGGRTSWYYTEWPLAGHVKGAIKPWETLLLSLVSLDLFVGMDKEYGDTAESGNPFYTSLLPWNRTASDMNDFAAYLRFNGWKL